MLEELDRTAASIFAQNPKLVKLIQGRLGSLVGQSSGYIESLPDEVKRRVSGLKGIQKEHSKLEAEFQEEVLQLEKKYFAKFTPLYEKRSSIVNGATEPSDEEIKAGEVEDEDPKEETEGAPVEEEKTAATSAEKVKGIPEFWLSAMKNQISLAEMITDRDEEALKALTDIRMEYLEKPGFRLIFEFGENEFFTNKTITKTYFYQNESGYGGDFIYDHAEGDKIDWKDGKDLTVRVEQKKQRNKRAYQLSGLCPSATVRRTTADILQTPSRPVLLRKRCLQSRSSTSSHLPRHRAKRKRMLRLTLRNVWNLTTNSARTSRRSSFLVRLIGSRVPLLPLRNLMKTNSRVNLTKRMMKMKKMMTTRSTTKRRSLTMMM